MKGEKFGLILIENVLDFRLPIRVLLLGLVITKFLSQLLLPVILILVLVVTWCLWVRLTKKKKKNQQKTSQTIN